MCLIYVGSLLKASKGALTDLNSKVLVESHEEGGQSVRRSRFSSACFLSTEAWKARVNVHLGPDVRRRLPWLLRPVKCNVGKAEQP